MTSANEPSRPVFLSYASQDAEAARRICEALRASGIEVWFDQSELVGGDSWDAKIRKQIKECALFVPVISAATQARHEGYFRLEWKLAAERTHMMSGARAFLLPVVIDDTRDADAHVPAEFRTVQWTRLSGGEMPPAFSARVRDLLDEDSGREPARARHDLEEGRKSSGERAGSVASLAKPNRGRGWLLSGVAALAVVAAIALWQRTRGGQLESERRPAEAPRSPASVAVNSAATEVQKHIARVWEIFEKEQDGTEEEWALAEDLGAKATALEPTNAEAWAAYACGTYNGSYALKGKKQEALQRAERAFALNSQSYDARFALAHLQRTEPATLAAAEKTFRELLVISPGDKRVHRGLGYTLRNRARSAGGPEKVSLQDEAFRLFDDSAKLPGGDASALVGKCGMLIELSRFREAKNAIDGALKIFRGPNAFSTSVQLLYQREGKIEEAAAELEMAPPEFWRKDGQAASAAWLWVCARQPAKAMAALRFVKGDLFDFPSIQGSFNGPKGLLVGMAHEMAGKRSLAEIEWRGALQAVERRLVAKPNEARTFLWKAWLLAALGRKEEARDALKIFEDYNSSRGQMLQPGLWRSFDDRAGVYLRLGAHEVVLEGLEQQVRRSRNPEVAAVMRNRLRFDPHWDALRENARFVTAMDDLEKFAKRADVKQ